MNIVSLVTWMAVAGLLGYCAGRLVSAFKYLPYIDRANRRNADLEHRFENMIDLDACEQEMMDNRFWRAANGIGRKKHA